MHTYAAYELRAQSAHHTRKRNALTDVLRAAEPRHGPLKSKPETAVHEGPILSEIEIPVVRAHVETFVDDALQQLVVIIFAL